MGFDRQPELKGRYLELRPLRESDLDELFGVAADPLIWEQHPDSDRYQREVFETFFRDALDSGGALVAIDSRNGEIIGSSRYHGYDSEKNEVEIGWTFLAHKYWGGLHNGEMKQLMLAHAFESVDRVLFRIGTDNIRSQRAIEKIGGVHTGSGRDAGGRISLVYEITK